MQYYRYHRPTHLILYIIVKIPGNNNKADIVTGVSVSPTGHVSSASFDLIDPIGFDVVTLGSNFSYTTSSAEARWSGGSEFKIDNLRIELADIPTP